ncbi:1-phosphatidylinositol 4,5-bisphosphate phosphodiesterase 1 [Fusarium oxysporum f. sp. albedinis]|nr:1-phosphatidylinositol 4,5-bisphosphate phosphodiesterase 1 [Fusarium oxysporum f. sp. albedinis]
MSRVVGRGLMFWCMRRYPKYAVELVTQDLNHYACLRLLFFNPAFVGRDSLPSLLWILVAFKKVINGITVLLSLYAGLCQTAATCQ